MIKNEELINILNALGFEWYDFEDSTDGSGGCFSKVRNNKEEWYYIRLTHFTNKWRVEVRTLQMNGKLRYAIVRKTTRANLLSKTTKSLLKI